MLLNVHLGSNASSFQNLPLCSLLLQFSTPCSFLMIFSAPFYFSELPAPFSFFFWLLDFFLCSMLLFRIFPCSMLLSMIFGARCSRIIICLLPAPLPILLFCSLLLAPLCQIDHAPCSRIIPNRGSAIG